MQDHLRKRPNRHAYHVRSHAGSALIAALIMLYFGFGQLAEPSVTDWYSRCNWLFYHTLRIGGIAMAVAAVLLWLGHAPALIADAVVSVAAGIVFILTGVGMLLGGGGTLQNVMIAVFGLMFASAGVRRWRDFAAHARPVERDGSAPE